MSLQTRSRLAGRVRAVQERWRRQWGEQEDGKQGEGEEGEQEEGEQEEGRGGEPRAHWGPTHRKSKAGSAICSQTHPVVTHKTSHPIADANDYSDNIVNC